MSELLNTNQDDIGFKINVDSLLLDVVCYCTSMMSCVVMLNLILLCTSTWAKKYGQNFLPRFFKRWIYRFEKMIFSIFISKLGLFKVVCVCVRTSSNMANIPLQQWLESLINKGTVFALKTDMGKHDFIFVRPRSVVQGHWSYHCLAVDTVKVNPFSSAHFNRLLKF